MSFKNLLDNQTIKIFQKLEGSAQKFVRFRRAPSLEHYINNKQNTRQQQDIEFSILEKEKTKKKQSHYFLPKLLLSARHINNSKLEF